MAVALMCAFAVAAAGSRSTGVKELDDALASARRHLDDGRSEMAEAIYATAARAHPLHARTPLALAK